MLKIFLTVVNVRRLRAFVDEANAQPTKRGREGEERNARRKCSFSLASRCVTFVVLVFRFVFRQWGHVQRYQCSFNVRMLAATVQKQIQVDHHIEASQRRKRGQQPQIGQTPAGSRGRQSLFVQCVSQLDHMVAERRRGQTAETKGASDLAWRSSMDNGCRCDIRSRSD
jgi:hypothetical protein